MQLYLRGDGCSGQTQATGSRGGMASDAPAIPGEIGGGDRPQVKVPQALEPTSFLRARP